MIRRFLGVLVFTVTVLTAVYGQNVFGRTHLEAWMQHVKTTGPAHARTAWQKTDTMLASLSPEAGGAVPYDDVCTITELAWMHKLAL